ncbi:hypothetical protein [Leifsonia sp. Leaf264]|uniref:hypothetical protein n=1 Tax=Leifsonia sp. Leaf264 TaxID=1736314 RepID=UPI0006FABAC6|nr:hypothetical protein [Leifsonia sp. Leaf264]KQO98647.1 hypothetical protein ASF30_11330 [Leifsonia sp. Leaf264]
MQPATILDTLAALAAAEAAVNSWDGRPSVALLISHDGILEVDPIPIPDELWERVEVHQMLPILARILGGTPGLHDQLDSAGATLDGVALFTEGWEVRVKNGPASDDLQGWLATNGVRDHPNRVEVKIVLALGVDGRRFSIQHSRDDNVAAEVLSGDDGKFSGRIWDGLTELLAAVSPVV